MTLHYKLAEQICFMSSLGYEVHAVVGEGPGIDDIPLTGDVTVHTVPLAREISPWQDVVSLWRTFWLLRSLRPQIVSASTPKAGLIGMLASWLNRVPIRIHTLRGLRHETLDGSKATVIKLMERITAFCATRVLSVSDSLRTTYLKTRLCRPNKVIVLGAGSSNGVDAERFDPGQNRRSLNNNIRSALGIPVRVPVIGFLGRFTKDKGFEELTTAFELVQNEVPECRLLLVGEFERGDPVPITCRHRLQSNPNVVFVPFVKDPSHYYAVLDVLAFPSYREGLPVVPLEAAAAAVPTVTFAATGCVDVVRNGETGAIVPLHDAEALGRALIQYVTNDDLRVQHGQAAQAWVRSAFKPEAVWRMIANEYRQQLLDKGLRAPELVPIAEQVPASHAVTNDQERRGDLIVIGCGGHGKVIIQTARAAGYRPVAMYDDDPKLWNTEFFGVPVIGPVAEIPDSSIPAVIALGHNGNRQRISEEVKCRLATIIHPNAIVDESAEVGVGSMILAGCIVQADAKVGRHVIMNTASTIDHDAIVGDFVHLCPGVHLAGVVELGDGVMMGVGSSAIPGTNVGAWTTVGAGSCVIRDIPGHVVAVGVPAVPVSSNQESQLHAR